MGYAGSNPARRTRFVRIKEMKKWPWIAITCFAAIGIFIMIGLLYYGRNQSAPRVIPAGHSDNITSPSTTTTIQNLLTPTGLSTSTNTSSFAVPIFSCTHGCDYGRNVANTVYLSPQPAPVTWVEGQSEVDVVGAHALDIRTKSPVFEGRILTLFFRVSPIVSSANSATYSVVQNLQMIYDEYGNSMKPITSTSSFFWENDPTTMNQIQTATFPIGTSTRLDFSVDDPSKVLFYATINDDGTITIAKEPTAD